MSLLRNSIKCKIVQYLYNSAFEGTSYSRHTFHRLYCSTLSHPTPDGIEKSYSPKITSIVEEIAKLTLIEVADLNECLKKKLNIKDVPMMMGAAMAAPGAAAADEEAEPEVIKSSFTVKLMSFEPTKKVDVIKQIKTYIDGMNLLQAKKFAESVPQVIKADVAKDEAENLKKAFESVGGTCEIS